MCYNVKSLTNKNWSWKIFLSIFFFLCAVKNMFSLKKDAQNGFIDFQQLVLKGMYVDKSLLISEILQRDEKVFQITRPRKWGKTINLDMIKRFFDVEVDANGTLLPDSKKMNPTLFRGGLVKFTNSEKLIEPLKISKVKVAMEHTGKHPVIYLNLSGIKGQSVSEIGEKLNNAVVQLYRSYPFIVKYLDNETTILDEDEIPRLDNFLKGNLDKEYVFDSLEFLSMLLFEHFESYVCLLIDDYDLPLTNAYLTFGEGSQYEFVTEMFRRFYDYSFKENQYLLKGVITGTLCFDIVPSGVGEFDYSYILYNNMFDEQFSDFYGFSENEVGKLIQNVHQIDGLKEWYGGVFINKTEIYNPGSIVGFYQKQEFDYFLLHTPSDLVEFINRGFSSTQFKDFLLLSGESKEIVINEYYKTVPLQNLANEFHSIFVNVGYLNLITPKRYAKEEIWRVKIPNLEIKGVFAAGFQRWISIELNITHSECCALLNLILKHEIKKFGVKLNSYFSRSGLYNLETDEEKYHNLMAALLASLALGNEVKTIREGGSYRGEGVVIPFKGFGKVVIHMEYNICKSLQKVESIVEESLQSLMLRPPACTHTNSFDHVEKILYVALGFLGDKVSIRSKLVDAKK